MSDGACSAAESVIATQEVKFPNELPPLPVPNYTQKQIEEYLKNMEDGDSEVFQIWKEFQERWENSQDVDKDLDFVDWLGKRAAKLVNLREVLMLKAMASFESYLEGQKEEPAEGEMDVAEKFEDDFKAVSFVNKIIYCIARVHNLKEQEEVKKYHERLEKEKEAISKDDVPAENVNFE